MIAGIRTYVYKALEVARADSRGNTCRALEVTRADSRVCKNGWKKKNWKEQLGRSFQLFILVSLFPHPQHICHHLHQPKHCEEERPKQRKFH